MTTLTPKEIDLLAKEIIKMGMRLGVSTLPGVLYHAELREIIKRHLVEKIEKKSIPKLSKDKG